MSVYARHLLQGADGFYEDHQLIDQPSRK